MTPAQRHRPESFCCLRFVVASGLAFALGCGSSTEPGVDPEAEPTEVKLALQEVVSGLSSPVYLTAPPGDARLFIVEQQGRIRIVQNGQLLQTPFLDITSRVLSGGERGLLSVAFHPSYATNGFLFVNFTDRNGDTRIERFRVSSDPNIADASSSALVLSVTQPFSNHNGGLNVFGTDGMLYIGMGDGGSAGDPLGHGQNRTTLLGDLLRIDVNRALPYTIPPDNPYAGRTDVRQEIWASGLRNPWRFSFDRVEGFLYVADVGQNRLEEVNVVRASQAAVNYGWNVMEGSSCFASASCSQQGLQLPATQYEHSAEACSVTGGFVYRGAAVPAIAGQYFYSDYCGGWLRSFRYVNGAVTDARHWEVPRVPAVTSFGEDAAGELYMISGLGRVYRIVRAAQ